MQQSERSIFDALAKQRAGFVSFARNRAPDLDAEDLVQQAFTRAQEKVHTLRDANHATAWLYRILRRIIADHFVKRAQQMGKLEQFGHDLGQVVDEDLAACACGLGLLADLKQSYRDVLEKADLEDLPLAKVAKNLNISRNNAAVRLHRARSTLRKLITKHCDLRGTAACKSCMCPSTALR